MICLRGVLRPLEVLLQPPIETFYGHSTSTLPLWKKRGAVLCTLLSCAAVLWYCCCAVLLSCATVVVLCCRNVTRDSKLTGLLLFCAVIWARGLYIDCCTAVVLCCSAMLHSFAVLLWSETRDSILTYLHFCDLSQETSDMKIVLIYINWALLILKLSTL